MIDEAARLIATSAIFTMAVACSSAGAVGTATEGSDSPSDPPRLATTIPAGGRDESDDISATEVLVEQALEGAMSDPLTGGECLSIPKARRVARSVLNDVGMADWAIKTERYARKDGCATASLGREGEVRISTTVLPDVHEALEAFRDHSLDECLDAETAIQELTEALQAVGHRDFFVRQMPYVAGPNKRWAEIEAHAEAGCVFYTLSNVEEDGTMLYYLTGG